MISGDNSGTIKYWQPDMSDVKDFKVLIFNFQKK